MADIDDFDDEEERKRRAAAGAPEFSYETIAADPWSAVYGMIPQGADAGLLRFAYDRVMECCNSTTAVQSSALPACAPLQDGYGADKSREENFEHAVRRLDELDSRLRPAMLDDETERQAPQQQQPAADLPPDPDKMNNDRAEWAASALRQFQCVTGTDYDDALPDMLADLMHWCDRNEFNFDRMLERARFHYEAETALVEPEVEEERTAEIEPEPMSLEMIERDPWNAVKLDLPEDASRDLLTEVYFTAQHLDRDAFERYEAAETATEAKQWADASREAEQRAEIANTRLAALDEQAETVQPLKPAAEKEPMTVEAIERDPWAAIDRAIPPDADRELLSLIAKTAYNLRGVERPGDENLPEESLFDQAGERHKEAVDALCMLDMRAAAAAPEFSRETIEADWWTAVYLPVPQNADPALLAHAREVAGWAREGIELTGLPAGALAYDPFVIGSEYGRAENIENASARIAELDERLELAREAAAARVPEPEQSDNAKLAKQILSEQGDMHSHYDIGPWEGGYAVFRTYEMDDAMLAEYGLATGTQKLGEAETLPELHQAIIDGSALTAYPLWITDAEREQETNTAAERRDHMTDYASYVGLEISERRPLAEDPGDDISRPLGAAELAERVRRIIENPILAEAERDDRVLQAVEERREELGLAEPAKQDDAPAVEVSQEPEVQSTADSEAAEIDYLFGREEMTEARAAAYDRWSGQELSPRTSQSAGQVQEPGQSQSQGRGRSR